MTAGGSDEVNRDDHGSEVGARVVAGANGITSRLRIEGVWPVENTKRRGGESTQPGTPAVPMSLRRSATPFAWILAKDPTCRVTQYDGPSGARLLHGMRRR